MCFVLISWKTLGICNYISKTSLLWCLWTFVEKKWRIEEASLVVAWSHSPSDLDVLAQLPRLDSPKRKACSPSKYVCWPSNITFFLNIKSVETRRKTEFGFRECGWNSRQRLRHFWGLKDSSFFIHSTIPTPFVL